jgi:glycosyltransferase involved in cell wall biosynthesis
MEAVSILIPIFNEADSVVDNTRALLRHLTGYRNLEFEVVFVENGSTDQTPVLLDELVRERPDIIKVHHLPKADYGAALRFGLGKISHDRIFVFQIDSMPMDFFDECLRDESFAMVLGSRRHPNAETDERPWIRRFLTNSLNWILSVVFKSPFHDTHGVKFLRMTPMRRFVEACKLDGGIFETEMVLRANLEGLPIREIPIPIRKYSPPKKSYFYKIWRNVVLVIRLFLIFYTEGLYRKRVK